MVFRSFQVVPNHLLYSLATVLILSKLSVFLNQNNKMSHNSWSYCPIFGEKTQRQVCLFVGVAAHMLVLELSFLAGWRNHKKSWVSELLPWNENFEAIWWSGSHRRPVSQKSEVPTPTSLFNEFQHFIWHVFTHCILTLLCFIWHFFTHCILTFLCIHLTWFPYTAYLHDCACMVCT